MSKTGWIGVAVAAVIIIAVGIWYMNGSTPVQTDTGTTTGTVTGSTDTGATTGTVTGSVDTSVTVETAPMTATVTYSGTSFTPSTVTIAKGGTVTFVDSSTRGFWIASDPHPAHSAYDGTSRSTHCAAGYTGTAPFDECATGSTFSFTFNKSGTFGYHDHMNDNASGTVIVK
ncbi:hypothetical protein K8R03_00215 [Candidatus Kaiserbacteria bacterium]|nr:hypothetical protein [Candidatus Kaiserbacteria bacterium]